MLSFVASILVAQVHIVAEPSRQPTLAAVCQCQAGGVCTCPAGECDCGPKETKPVISVARFDRVNNSPTSPITLAPDPDYDNAIAAFTARHADGKSKVYSGPTLDLEDQLVRENSIRRVPSNKPFVSNYRRSDPPAAVSSGTRPPAVSVQPPEKEIPPQIDRDHMQRVFVGYECQGGVCVAKYEYRPTAQAPTKSVQRSYQRRGLFGLRRR